MWDYPDRVTRGADGVYRWRCAVGKDFERQGYKLTLWVCGGFSLLFIIMGLVMGIDRKSMLVTVLSCLGVMAIAVLVCLIFDRLPGNTYQSYELRDEWVRAASAKSAYFVFRKARKVTLCQDYIKLKGAVSGMRVYVPREDYDLVKGFILTRIPGEAEIVYDN